MKPKKLVGAQIFSLPILQLGDLVQIDYNKDGVDLICSPAKQFVIYNMDYQRNSNGPSMTVYLAEV
jgi:hypothetical protein